MERPAQTEIPNIGGVFRPGICVIGVGGAGGNAVDNMIRGGLEGVVFVSANTDSQALSRTEADHRIQLGVNVTQGLGAGSNPEIGRAAAEETADELGRAMDGAHMVFITAGMGGGTGTGAAPVIARISRDRGLLTVGVVTKPFGFEGSRRMRQAEAGLEELESLVDTLIVIPNQNLLKVADKGTTFADAFRMADDVLQAGVRGVTDLMVMPGLVNLDFADIRTVMSEMGKAMMGTGEAEGDQRAVEAAEAAIANPLLDNVTMTGARGVLINITGGKDMTLFEVDQAANRIRADVDADANIIFGSAFDQDMKGRMRVSVIATGITASAPAAEEPGSRAASPLTPPYSSAPSPPAAAPPEAASEPQISAVSTEPTLSISIQPRSPVSAVDEGGEEMDEAAGAARGSDDGPPAMEDDGDGADGDDGAASAASADGAGSAEMAEETDGGNIFGLGQVSFDPPTAFSPDDDADAAADDAETAEEEEAPELELTVVAPPEGDPAYNAIGEPASDGSGAADLAARMADAGPPPADPAEPEPANDRAEAEMDAAVEADDETGDEADEEADEDTDMRAGEHAGGPTDAAPDDEIDEDDKDEDADEEEEETFPTGDIPVFLRRKEP